MKKEVWLPPGVNALLKPDQVAAVLAISRSQFYRMVDRGEFPRSESLYERDPRWRVSTVNDWINKNYGGAK